MNGASSRLSTNSPASGQGCGEEAHRLNCLGAQPDLSAPLEKALPRKRQGMMFGRMEFRAFVAGQAISLMVVLSLGGRPAAASGNIGYGSRAGMEVTVISIEGLNT